MIKILVDAHCFDGAGQGIVSYIQGIYAELLKNQEYKVTFACSDIERAKTIMDKDIDVLRIPKSNFIYRLLYFFPKILRTGNYQYAHFQYNIPLFLSKKVKYITTIHDIIPIDFPKYYSFFYRVKVNIFFRFAAKKSNIVLTVSDYSKNRIAERFKIDKNKIYITPNAVKKIFCKSLNDKNQVIRPYFLYVSRIEERKNHLFLLKAFIEKKYYEKYDLIFIGKDSSKNIEFHKYYASISEEIKAHIKLISNISDEELSEYYLNARLFIYPSIAEGFGIPPIEAAFAKCIVLCSNATAMEDFDFFKKYSFSPNKQDELVEKIELALKDENYPYDNIIKSIESKYSWKQSAMTIKNIIDSYEKK